MFTENFSKFLNSLSMALLFNVDNFRKYSVFDVFILSDTYISHI